MSSASTEVPFATPAKNDDWMKSIRGEHPRLFFNHDTWPAVKERALGPARDYYDQLKQRVDDYPDEPTGDSGGAVFLRKESIGGKTYEMPTFEPATEWGVQALESAFVFWMTGERQYLEKAKRMLEVSIEVYRECYRLRRVVNWYSTTRVCALVAYDWIASDLGPLERRSLLRPLLEHIEEVQPGPGKPKIHGQNTSSHMTGFYGVRNLLWYAGLAAYGDGINDEAAREFLRDGYQNNCDVLNFRKDIAGDDGGLASATIGYAMGAYPYFEANLFHSWRSATGEELARQWPYLALFPVWIYWSWLPTEDGPKEFGSGDTYHDTNALRTYCLYDHMSSIMHFYGRSHPDCAALASYIRSIVPEQGFTSAWPVHPFLLTEVDHCPPPTSPHGSRIFARHFEGLGQVSMRSGATPDDTYCLYTIGSKAPNHQHYDEGHFTIYHKGFLALDSGTRGNQKDFHLRHYYAQTVAHNCLLIHLPDEPLADYWGEKYEGPEGQTNYGGMNRYVGGVVRAYETNEHYTYVASDLTPCYRDRKCELVLRQFVFLMPDIFVVCDRVVSTRPEYAKAWLLHTQNEPELTGKQFRADEGSGRLFCRTLYPRDGVLTTIGGPGKEFWANGTNWELHDAVKERDREQRETTGRGMLLGAWRVEVRPGEPRAEDLFLHLVQVADQDQDAMIETQLVETEHSIGVRMETDGRTAEFCFGRAGGPSGRIRLQSSDDVLLDGDLTQKVMPQAGPG